MTAVCKLKDDKAIGLDGIASETIKYACPRLSVHLCILFNLFLKYGYIPEHFMQSVFVPLLKNKCGDLSDMKNYRAIAISNALSKVFESVLVDPLICHADADQFQFGFKKSHSSGLCTSTF